jgi:hypothetical protein
MKKQLLLLYFLLSIIINAHAMNMQNLQKYAWPTIKVAGGITLLGIYVLQLPIKNKTLRTIVDFAKVGYSNKRQFSDGRLEETTIGIPFAALIGAYLAYNGTKELLKIKSH